jgi:hypothetical protein
MKVVRLPNLVYIIQGYDPWPFMSWFVLSWCRFTDLRGRLTGGLPVRRSREGGHSLYRSGRGGIVVYTIRCREVTRGRRTPVKRAIAWRLPWRLFSLLVSTFFHWCDCQKNSDLLVGPPPQEKLTNISWGKGKGTTHVTLTPTCAVTAWPHALRCIFVFAWEASGLKNPSFNSRLQTFTTLFDLEFADVWVFKRSQNQITSQMRIKFIFLVL